MSPISLVPITLKEHVEWLRVQRNRPELYKYFRQDKPISPAEQAGWWQRHKHSIRIFMAYENGARVGYAGFNPIFWEAKKAEFGVFVVPEHAAHGIGRKIMLKLLKKGFHEYNFNTIYSDVLDYPGEDKYRFYHRLGFVRYPNNVQNKEYLKQGVMIPAIRFYMTRNMYDKENQNKLES